MNTSLHHAVISPAPGLRIITKFYYNANKYYKLQGGDGHLYLMYNKYMRGGRTFYSKHNKYIRGGRTFDIYKLQMYWLPDGMTYGNTEVHRGGAYLTNRMSGAHI